MKDDVTVIAISDIHLFNQLNPTNLIVDHAIKWFGVNKEKLKKADILFMAGDWFDRGVRYASPEVYQSLQLVTYIGRFCLRHDIVLRFLEGTKSHDMNQLDLLIEHLSYVCVGLDVKLHKTVNVEHIESLEMDVLYVPDDMGSADHVWGLTQQALADAGVTKVDMACMHGCFTYQLPMITHPASHEEANYMSIVKYYITIGHHHIYNPYEKGIIIPQGSLDRISFGQDGPKGGVIAYLGEGQEMHHEFIENKDATDFTKYHLTGDVVADEKAIRKLTLKNSELMHIRLVGKRNMPLIDSTRALKNKYPHVIFTSEKTDAAAEVVTVGEVGWVDIPVVTKDNFPEVLGDYLIRRDHPHADKLVAKLRSFINAND